MASTTAAAAPRPARIPPIAFAFALSIALHALLLLVHFQLPEYRPAADRGLEVVLVNARHAKAPEEAEVLAQTNIDAGGSNAVEATPSTPLPPREVQREGDALAETRRRAPPREAPQKPVLTAPRAPVAVARRERAEEAPTPQPQPVASGLDLLDSAAAIARVEARIDRNLQPEAARPRKKFIGARAKEYRFAQYVEDWRLKVERVGMVNYPEAARGRLYGSLLLSVTIRADGKVQDVAVHRSSGHKVLDDAAVRIVRLAAPYAPFPPDIARDTDLIEITRTWSFTSTDRVRTN
ncbi:energy transducer TonB [Thauera phenolivorans]|uniref:energy transducer TonB n=1 Tax=Thauera phenolivorans TaxID=1792543 RepID=UPI00083A3B89|nr:TonB family protein [Thauera phenolivorans]